MYRGCLFRSRLEARWAAYFDLQGWEWVYEPVDLKGWTPDFHLKIGRYEYFVEVKPIPNEEMVWAYQRSDLAKVLPFCVDQDVLVLGLFPTDHAVGVLLRGVDPLGEEVFGGSDVKALWNEAGTTVRSEYYWRGPAQHAALTANLKRGLVPIEGEA